MLSYHPARDPSPRRRAARQRRLTVCTRDRRGQARSPDQQLPPPARRGHRFRGRSAAARRVALEELLDDGPRGDLRGQAQVRLQEVGVTGRRARRSEEHTSELQSQSNLVCRLLLEKKKKKDIYNRLHMISN